MNNEKEFKQFLKDHPEVETVPMMMGALVGKVYKNAEEAQPFMDHVTKMMRDREYLPDKMLEMPGRDEEAESLLREFMGRFLQRRI